MKQQPDAPAIAGGLSLRGSVAAASVVRADTELYYQAVQNRYHAVDNPRGALPMNVAENRLAWAALEKKIHAVCRENAPPQWTAGYAMSIGAPEVRGAVADYLSEHVTGCPMESDCMALTAGATAALELAAFLLGDSGDVAAFPAPCYPTYTHTLGARAGLRRYDIVTHHEVANHHRGPLLSPVHLDEVKADIEGQGACLRLLVLTAPDNPTGAVYSRQSLESIADWCIAHRVHLLVNEIYAASLIDTRHPELVADYAGHEPFASFGPILEQRHSDFLHYCYAFSKDFGLAGFRLGLLYSRNEALMAGMANLNTAHLASSHTQWIVESVLRDRAFVAKLVTQNQHRLTETYVSIVRVLRRYKLTYVPARGGLFVWVDLSPLLEADSAAAERALWLSIFREAGLLLTPGAGFGHIRHGMFRIVYTSLTSDELAEAVRRLDAFLADRVRV